MHKMATRTCINRLRQDFARLKKDPVPYVTATPLDSNILEWHYVVNGPEGTPYEGEQTKGGPRITYVWLGA